MPHQIDQHVEYLWFNVNDGAFSTELTSVYLDFAVFEQEGHVLTSRKNPAFLRQASSVRSGHQSASHGIIRP
jgi:hypothetical protein